MGDTCLIRDDFRNEMFDLGPDTIPDIHLWLDMTDPSANGTPIADGAPITDLVDKVNGFKFIPASTNAAQFPIYKTGAMNGNPAMTMDATQGGVRQVPGSGIAHPVGPWTIFIVSQQPAADYFLMDTLGSTVAQRLITWVYPVGTNRHWYYQSGFHAGPQLDSTTAEVFAWRFDAAQTPSAEFRNSGAVFGTENTYVAQDLGQNLSFGSRYVGFAPTDFDGMISSVIIYSRYLTNAEVVQVETYLQSKWGV